MSYLTSNGSYDPYRYQFDFFVGEYHVGKEKDGKKITLNFKSTDGLKTIQKRLVLKFVREKKVKNNIPKWVDTKFNDLPEIIFKEND